MAKSDTGLLVVPTKKVKSGKVKTAKRKVFQKAKVVIVGKSTNVKVAVAIKKAAKTRNTKAKGGTTSTGARRIK